MNESEKALLAARRLADLGRWHEALRALGPATASAGTAYEALCLRAYCRYNIVPTLDDLSLDRHRQSVGMEEDTRAALAIDPNGVWAHRLLAHILLGKYQEEAALREAEEAARLDPTGALTLRTLVTCQLAVSKVDAAWRTAHAALAADPEDPLAHLTVAEVARRRGDPAGEERAYREGLRLDPDHEDLALGLAQILTVHGDPLEAAEAWLAAARINPRNDALKDALRLIWRHVWKTTEMWERNPVPSNAVGIGELADVMEATCSPIVSGAVRDFLSLASESRANTQELLKRALDVLGTVAESFDSHLSRAPEPGRLMKEFDVPAPEAYRPLRDSDWRFLDMERDPLPRWDGGVRLAVSVLRYNADRTAEYGEQFDAAIRVSSDLRVQGDDGSDFHEIMARVHAKVTGLATAYRACADVLAVFAAVLRGARKTVRLARDRAEDASHACEKAVTDLLALVPLPVRPEDDGRADVSESTVGRPVLDLPDPAARTRAIDLAREARKWEEIRRQAGRIAATAVASHNEAEARCAQAVHRISEEAISRGLAGPGGVR
ncbi:hypothetical protein [Streptosporangium sandarakinum]|uniref:hypothetical protein n=1 Tax=Streptosporangium sandarakinum TaxID=1260955 RepID=UPI003431CAD6